jgi:hypothetical protein
MTADKRGCILSKSHFSHHCIIKRTFKNIIRLKLENQKIVNGD